MLDLSSPPARPFRVLGPEAILRELRSPIELSQSWPIPERFQLLDVFGIGWIDTDSDRFLEWNLYASTSEPPVRPGSHPYVTHRATLLFAFPQARVDPAWCDPRDPDGIFWTLARAVPVDLQRKWRADLGKPAPSLPVESVPDNEFAALLRRGDRRGP